mgnify:CR=1 FL=1|tara:strand:+ start:573 stop:851 length:279 start_codon:yes stop_codon:yes gene_type:complete
MADLHKAIRAIHNEVITINGDTQETIVAKDKDGNNINVNWTSVNAWTDPEEYKYKRAAEYPTIKDQLDDIYHNGIEGWKTTIKEVKDKYPKE